MEYLAHHIHNSGMNNGTETKKRARRSSAKVERKIIEKNRRKHMKNLYSTLNSLLPHPISKEPLSLPDQIDEAVNYIKSLKTKLSESRKKKESLLRKIESYRCTNTTNTATETNIETRSSLNSPEIKINENGSAMEVVLVTGPDCQFMFYDMISIFHEHGAEVLNASLSTVGNTSFQIVHAEIGEFVGAHMIKDKLNKFVHGSSFEDDELQQELWDFEIHPETWDFPIM